jgi:hypothetical protein
MSYLHPHQQNRKPKNIDDIEITARVISKATLKNEVEDREKKKQLRCAKRIIKDPLLFNI